MKRGKWLIGIDTGPLFDSSHLGRCFHMPGIDCGMHDQGEMIPALPMLAP